MDKVSKESIYAELGRHLCGELKDHKGPIPGTYQHESQKDQDVWLAYPSNNHDCVGISRTIVISKKTGELIGDYMIGE